MSESDEWSSHRDWTTASSPCADALVRVHLLVEHASHSGDVLHGGEGVSSVASIVHHVAGNELLLTLFTEVGMSDEMLQARGCPPLTKLTSSPVWRKWVPSMSPAVLNDQQDPLKEREVGEFDCLRNRGC